MPCHEIQGAWRHDEVNIGWYRCRTLREIVVRSRPSESALAIKTIARGKTLGRQSVRNPQRLARPARRPSVNGYVWCYGVEGGKNTGWVKKSDIEEIPPTTGSNPLGGPAGEDFEVGRTFPKRKIPSTCGKKSTARPKRKVKVERLYLRYSPRGTAYHHLHKGDRVQVLIADGPHGFHAVKVLSGSSVRDGAVGWVEAIHLEEL